MTDQKKAPTFIVEFKDPDLLGEISAEFPHEKDEDDCVGDRWRSRFTQWGDYARIELNMATGRFRFLPYKGKPDPWPEEPRAIAAEEQTP